MTDGWGIFCKIAARWMPLDFTDDKSTLVQVMAWCRQATSHYLSHCWPRSLAPYGVTRPQWVNLSQCVHGCICALISKCIWLVFLLRKVLLKDRSFHICQYIHGIVVLVYQNGVQCMVLTVVINKMFCSWSVMPCAKFRKDLNALDRNTTIYNFQIIWIVWEKSWEQ